jgi:hypothetical protein
MGRLTTRFVYRLPHYFGYVEEAFLSAVHGVNDVRQTGIYTAEPLVPQSSTSEVDMAIEKLKGHKSPGIDQIPTELMKTGGRTIRYEIQ